MKDKNVSNKSDIEQTEFVATESAKLRSSVNQKPPGRQKKVTMMDDYACPSPSEIGCNAILGERTSDTG